MDGLSFRVRPGEILGLLGPNGAGKSTTVKMLYGALAPDSGRIIYGGRNFSEHRQAVKLCIGVCSQNDTLDYDLGVHENLRIFASYYRMRPAEAASRADALIERFELKDYAADTPRVMSGGLKRKLQIARALVNSPDILFLDEPTTGLDPHARRELWNLLHELRLEGITIILTTHYMEEAETLADNIILMDEGHLVQEGRPRELIERHFGPWALQIHETHEVLDRIKKLGLVHASGFGQVTVFAGTEDDADALQAEFASEVVLRRRPNLEDVFMKLSGRQL